MGVGEGFVVTALVADCVVVVGFGSSAGAVTGAGCTVIGAGARGRLGGAALPAASVAAAEAVAGAEGVGFIDGMTGTGADGLAGIV
ncbi:hypothetical protein, partial [Arthrobacter sp. Bi26]|uniref:hypothetical protein n=1 Tax=Arthrobacter sp. Bi26 TaxID=2822350 RepID=UPI001E2975FE